MKREVVGAVSEVVWDEGMVRHDAGLVMAQIAWPEIENRIGGATLLELVALDEMQAWIETARGQLVSRARLDDDHSWTEIGFALGVSKQAAAKRYGTKT